MSPAHSPSNKAGCRRPPIPPVAICVLLTLLTPRSSSGTQRVPLMRAMSHGRTRCSGLDLVRLKLAIGRGGNMCLSCIQSKQTKGKEPGLASGDASVALGDLVW
ncbi:hypothetical protein F5X97DRAFT_309127 [Nemania serpens]|nr:hypothetical protein F5X97DRAFT_309127 [Nemania serpens]